MPSDLRIFKLLERVCESIEPVANARISACIVFKGKIIAFGHNQNKSHPFQRKFAKNEQSIFLHAEIDAIKNALREITVEDLKKADLYICRIKRNWNRKLKKFEWGLARPCSGCRRAISTFEIRNVYYTTNIMNVVEEF